MQSSSLVLVVCMTAYLVSTLLRGCVHRRLLPLFRDYTFRGLFYITPRGIRTNAGGGRACETLWCVGLDKVCCV